MPPRELHEIQTVDVDVRGADIDRSWLRTSADVDPDSRLACLALLEQLVRDNRLSEGREYVIWVKPRGGRWIEYRPDRP